jgi:hypothetical protein
MREKYCWLAENKRLKAQTNVAHSWMMSHTGWGDFILGGRSIAIVR